MFIELQGVDGKPISVCTSKIDAYKDCKDYVVIYTSGGHKLSVMPCETLREVSP